MALLSRPIKRQPPARSTRPAMPLVALETHGATLALANTRIEACAEGALWLTQSQTLIVSDLHLEKGSSYAPSGQLLPPYDTRSTLRRLTAVMKRLAPKRVV